MGSQRTRSISRHLRIPQTTKTPETVGPLASHYDDLAVQSDIILRPCLQTNLRLSSAIHPPAQPSDQLPTLIGYCILRPAFEPTSDFRRRSVLRLNPWTNFQYSSDIASSGPAFEPTSDFHRRSIFRLNPRTNFQHSSDIASSGHAFEPISDFRRRSIFRLGLRINFRP